MTRSLTRAKGFFLKSIGMMAGVSRCPIAEECNDPKFCHFSIVTGINGYGNGRKMSDGEVGHLAQRAIFVEQKTIWINDNLFRLQGF